MILDADISAATKASWGEVSAEKTGIYGFARSFTETIRKHDSAIVPPYFFRGSLTTATVNTWSEVIVDSAEQTINEEIELAIIFDRESYCSSGFYLRGFTFASDLTDLAIFRRDAANILWSKSSTTTLLPFYFSANKLVDLPNSMSVRVEKYSEDGRQDTYQTLLGTDHCVVAPSFLSSLVAKFNGIECFDRVILFCGAAPGFEMREGCRAPQEGDVIRAVISSFNAELTLTLKNDHFSEYGIDRG